jgi:hypothetical protein
MTIATAVVSWEYYRWTPVNERYLPKAKTTLDNAVKLVSDATVNSYI